MKPQTCRPAEVFDMKKSKWPLIGIFLGHVFGWKLWDTVRPAPPLETNLGLSSFKCLEKRKRKAVKKMPTRFENKVRAAEAHHLSEGPHGGIFHMFPLFADPVGLIWNHYCYDELHQEQDVLKTQNNGITLRMTVIAHGSLSPPPTSTMTAIKRRLPPLNPFSCPHTCTCGDSSSSQQLDTTEAKLKISKAIWNTERFPVKWCCETIFFVVVVFSADLPDAHVSHRGVEGFAEEFANLISVWSDLCHVVKEKQNGSQRKHAGEKT